MFITPNTDFIRLNRRRFLAAASGLIAAGLLPRSALAYAGGPHTFTHGAFTVTVLSDGAFELPLSVISPNAKPEDLVALMGLAADAKGGPAEISPVLLSSGAEVILFDTGTGGMMGPTAGTLGESLKAAGVSPDAVTRVIFTHAHPDHLWGTIAADGSPVFANATYHMSEAEVGFWSNPGLASMMPAEMADMIAGTQKQLAAIREKITTFTPGSEVLPGIAAIDTSGHTPGHVSFELAGGDGLILTGDAITVPAVFFAHPEWSFGFDADGALASTNRRKLLDMAAAGKKQMLGYHWPFPGLGRAEAKDGAFAYVAG